MLACLSRSLFLYGRVLKDEEQVKTCVSAGGEDEEDGRETRPKEIGGIRKREREREAECGKRKGP